VRGGEQEQPVSAAAERVLVDVRQAEVRRLQVSERACERVCAVKQALLYSARVLRSACGAIPLMRKHGRCKSQG
jgi:hypothetical protein